MAKAGEFFPETTGYMTDIQDQALVAIIKIITSRVFLKDLNITNDICRKCWEKILTTPPIIGAGRAVAQGDFTHCHSQVNNVIRKEITIKCGMWKRPSMSYCKYELQSALEKCGYKLQYDRSTLTDRTVRYNKPDIGFACQNHQRSIHDRRSNSPSPRCSGRKQTRKKK